MGSQGRASVVEGGLRVSGRWSFCSGISHSQWLFAGCMLDSQEGSGQPILRVVALPKGELEILDTWHTSGLRGTGSHDAVANELFVPERHVLALLDGAPRVDAPLYRFPIFGFFALSIAAAALGNARGAIDDLSELAGAKAGQGSSRVLAERPATQAAVGEAEAALRAARSLYYEAIGEAWAAAQDDGPVPEHLRLGLRLAATHAVRASADVARSMYDLGGGTAIYEDSPLQRRFRDAHTATAHFQVESGDLGAGRSPAAGSADKNRPAVSGSAGWRHGDLQVVAPFWLDRPEEEVIEIALEARRNGFETMWLGEMASFDAFALATAVGLRAPGLRLKIGPLAVGVRSPVALALGLSSVRILTGAGADLALGASSPDIVAGWHDRPWSSLASRARETIEALRPILAGERAAYSGEHVRTQGFRLRCPTPEATIALAAFGPQMTRVAASSADEVLLNLVTPERVALTRAAVEAEARSHGTRTPRIAVWVTVALNPGPATLTQMASQIAVYLRPPGYGEMFAELGFGDLVERARAGAKRSELAGEITVELLSRVCAIGSSEQVAGRLAEYRAAGAEHIGVVPATAEDPAGHRVLTALSRATGE